jgi:CRP/FNR family transcriptional regulator
MSDTEKRAALLQQVPMFSDLKRQDLDELAAATVVRNLGKGEVLFEEGAAAKGFYLLVEGRIKVYRVNVEGREQILHLISPGETFAEVALFSGSTYPATAQALAASRVLFFPRRDLTRMVEKNPQLTLNMMAGFARWVRQFNQMLAEHSKSVPSRLAGYILAEGRRQHAASLADGSCVTLVINKTEIASFLGTISATLSRSFGQLREAGLIDVADREITILDLSGLRDVAERESLSDA